MSKIDAVIDILNNVWDENDVINAWNEMCDKHSYDEHIYYMESFNELHDGLEPLKIVDIVRGRDFCTGDDYFGYDGYGRIESFSDLEDYTRFNYEQLAEYLIENGDGDVIASIDRDDLLAWFVDDYFGGYDSEEFEDLVNNTIEEEGFDLLTDDWDDLEQMIKERRENE